MMTIRIRKVKNPKEESATNAAMLTPLSMLDQLKSKRSDIARRHSAIMRKFDRHIQLVESSGAEEIMNEAGELLDTTGEF